MNQREAERCSASEGTPRDVARCRYQGFTVARASGTFRFVTEQTERGKSMKSRSGLRQRVLTLAVATACGLVCGGAFAGVPMRSASPVRVGAPVRAPAAATQFVTVAAATRLGNGAHVTSAVPLTHATRITVAMKLRNDAQLKAYISKPHAPLSRAQLMAQYLPTAAQVQQVKTYLQANGFRDINVSRDNLLVHAVGNQMALKQAFHTSLVNVRTADGRNAYANSTAVQLPASVKANVVAVLGLQNVHVYHAQPVKAQPMAAGPTEVTGHLTPEFASIYDAANLAPASGIDVAVWGWGSMTNTVADDVAWLAANPSVTIATNGNAPQVVCTDVGGTEDPNTGVITGGTTTVGDASCGSVPDVYEIESAMDTQTILGITGGVNSLTIYAAFDPSSQGLQDALDAIISPPTGVPLAKVIDASFGGCELFSGPDGDNSMVAMDTAFQVADGQGQTIGVSTGDSGYDECMEQINQYAPGYPYNRDEAASSPANSPYVVAVGGTTLRTTVPAAGAMPAWFRENVWFDGGGSPSSLETASAYQAPLTYGAYAGQRGPDVAFDANPGTGAIYYVGAGAQLIQVGGTSLAAPLFTGAWARVLQADAGNATPLGWAGPNLYAAYTTNPGAFHDVTAGNNRGVQTVGGYIARPGWDWATGLGSFDVSALANALAK